MFFAFGIFLTACGGKGTEESGWSAWQGIASGDDISVVIERTEGAWEFICFLIGDEVQGTSFDCWTPPVNKKVFDDWMQESIAELTGIQYINGVRHYTHYFGQEISQERREEYKRAIDEARPLPTRILPILTIIMEEAEDYFDGSKSAEQVSDVVNNRVQLYLDENH